MAVFKNKNETWSVKMYTTNGKRVEKRFKKKADAESFETQTKTRSVNRNLFMQVLRRPVFL